MTLHPKIEYLIQLIASGATTIEIEAACNEFDLNEVDIHGRTPLIVAAGRGFLAVVETLVRYGASIHATGQYQVTALHTAAANGEVAVARYLLSLGANIDAETIDGVTPLMCAAAWGYTEVVKLLLENGADWTKMDRTGAHATDIAREKGEDGTADLIDLHAKNARQRLVIAPGQ